MSEAPPSPHPAPMRPTGLSVGRDSVCQVRFVHHRDNRSMLHDNLTSIMASIPNISSASDILLSPMDFDVTSMTSINILALFSVVEFRLPSNRDKHLMSAIFMRGARKVKTLNVPTLQRGGGIEEAHLVSLAERQHQKIQCFGNTEMSFAANLVWITTMIGFSRKRNFALMVT